MRTLIQKAPLGRPKRTIGLLTGSYSEPEDFVREGFPAVLAGHPLDIEFVMAEMRPAWFADGSIVERIHASLVSPALERGFPRVWLGGISLGALAAMAYAARHESRLEGLLLLSPYPGTRPVLAEMDAAGGLASWNPAPSDDLEREAWRWVASAPAARLPVFCYFGSDDRFAPEQRRIARALAPAAKGHELAGGHDWSAWRDYWQHFLIEAGSTLQ